jgi:DNA polymerase/3'-5' exonuclease PolX
MNRFIEFRKLMAWRLPYLSYLLLESRKENQMGATINNEIAAHLNEIARLLDEQGANQFRVRAYQRAAETLRNLKRPVDRLIKAGGLEAIRELPGIGIGLARSIRQFVLTGRLPTLDRLRGESDPIASLASVSGIGGRLAERMDIAGR